MLIVMTIFVALLFGAFGGFLFHLQQPQREREAFRLHDIEFPQVRAASERQVADKHYHLGVVGDCLFGAVGGLLLLAVLNRLLGNFVAPIFQLDGVSAASLEAVFAGWLYLLATATAGGYGGLRLLRLFSGSSQVVWKRQLEMQKENLAILEAELRESRAGVLVFDALARLREGFYREALSRLESALALLPNSPRVLGLVALCKSFLAEERNRVPDQEHLTFDQALADFNEAIRLAEDPSAGQADRAETGPIYYNRACVRYLKWRSQGRFPSKLNEEEVGKLTSDIEKALEADPARTIWRALLADCGLGRNDLQADDPNATRDFRDLYENSNLFRTFVTELKEKRNPSAGVTPLYQKPPVSLPFDELQG